MTIGIEGYTKMLNLSESEIEERLVRMDIFNETNKFF